MKRVFAFCILGVILTQTAVSATKSEDWKKEFQKASDEYFDQVFFPYQPTQGTLTGYHRFDTKLEDYSKASLDAQIAALHSFEKRISAIPREPLGQATSADRELVLSSIRSTLLSLEVIKPWEKNPDNYSGSISGAAFSLMERKFASPEERLKSLIAREKLMPKTLTDAKANLKNPPKIYTEIAIEQLPGIVSFFQNDVPLAFGDVKDAALNAQFAKTNAVVIAALNDYQAWVEGGFITAFQGGFPVWGGDIQQEARV